MTGRPAWSPSSRLTFQSSEANDFRIGVTASSGGQTAEDDMYVLGPCHFDPVIQCMFGGGDPDPEEAP